MLQIAYLRENCLILIYGTGIFITARKRGLGQGNVFTGVCLSTGECVYIWVQGCVCLCVQGCVCLWVWGCAHAPPDTPRHTPPIHTPPDTQTSLDTHAHAHTRSRGGRYASYWNAVLSIINTNCLFALCYNCFFHL